MGGKKRTFESVTGSAHSEKARSLEVWNKISKKPILDITKGVNKHIVNEQRNTALQKRDKSGKVKNQRFKKGAQSATDKKKQKKMLGKGKTLGKDDTKDWCMEVPVNADPYEDQFEKKKTEKKERKDIDLAKLSTASLGKFQ